MTKRGKYTDRSPGLENFLSDNVHRFDEEGTSFECVSAAGMRDDFSTPPLFEKIMKDPNYKLQ